MSSSHMPYILNRLQISLEADDKGTCVIDTHKGVLAMIHVYDGNRTLKIKLEEDLTLCTHVHVHYLYIYIGLAGILLSIGLCDSAMPF